MNIQTLHRSPAEAELIEQFEAEEVSPQRAEAFARFADSGLPTRRNEAWHYLDLRALVTGVAPTFARLARLTRARSSRPASGDGAGGATRLVLVDGWFAEALSDKPPDGVTIGAGDALSADDALVSLNEAMAESPLAVTVAAGAAPQGAIEVVHLAVGGEARSLYSRVAIALQAGACASVIERFVGAGPATQRNALTSLSLGDGASAQHVALIEDNPGLHIESQIGRLGKKAILKGFGLVAGGALTRRQLFIEVAGADAKLALGGLALIDGSRRADTTLKVTHSATGGESREFYRAIVDDDGIGIFQGKIIVEPAAQKTDGAMKSQAVLLSPNAQMNAKPELEIFADDVVCGHGATVAALDPEQLFYMRARGVPKPEAEAMLLEGFGAEAIDRIEEEALAAAATARFRQWLSSGRAGEGATP